MSWPEEALLTLAPFSRKSLVMNPFMSPKTVNMVYFTERCGRNFFFICESVYFYSMD